MKPILVALIVAVGLTALGAEKAPMTKQQLHALIQKANTPKDHAALAEYYRYEAKHLQERAAQHEALAIEYERNPAKQPLPKYPTMAQHCKDWAENYRQAAKKAEAMAEMHAEMAKAPK